MRKLQILVAALLVGGMSSCTVTYHNVTNNPVGTKKGQARAGMFQADADYSFGTAAKKGNINKIGTTTFIYSPFGVRTIVTGE